MPLPDASLLRAAVLVVLALCVGAMVAVLRLYARAWRNAPTRGRLTPMHVTVVSGSMSGFQALLAWALMEAVSTGAPASTSTLIRTAGYGVCSLGFLVAMWAVGMQQRRRLGRS